MPRRSYPPTIAPLDRTVPRHAASRLYIASNGAYTDPGYQAARVEVRRTPDGGLLIDVCAAYPGVQVHCGPAGPAYTFPGTPTPEQSPAATEQSPDA